MKFKKQLGSYGPKKGEGRCFSTLAKFTVVGKFLVGDEGIEGRGKQQQDERKGRGRTRSQLQGFKQLLCLSYKFPSITNGREDSRKNRKSRQKRGLTLTA